MESERKVVVVGVIDCRGGDGVIGSGQD